MGLSRPNVRRCRVLLVGGGLLRSCLAAGLRLEGLEVVGECRRVTGALSKAHLLDFEVLVAEQTRSATSLSAIDLALLLRKRQPELGVVLLSDIEDPRLVGRTHDQLPLGCRWLLKQQVEHLEVLADAILEAAQAPRLERPDGVPKLGLTDSQIEVWRLLATGATNHQIAEHRCVSVKAVEQAVHRLSRRLGLHLTEGHRRVQLARAYYEVAAPIEMVDLGRRSPDAPAFGVGVAQAPAGEEGVA